jgi:hypothetical protein
MKVNWIIIVCCYNLRGVCKDYVLTALIHRFTNFPSITFWKIITFSFKCNGFLLQRRHSRHNRSEPLIWNIIHPYGISRHVFLIQFPFSLHDGRLLTDECMWRFFRNLKFIGLWRKLKFWTDCTSAHPVLPPIRSIPLVLMKSNTRALQDESALSLEVGSSAVQFTKWISCTVLYCTLHPRFYTLTCTFT